MFRADTRLAEVRRFFAAQIDDALHSVTPRHVYRGSFLDPLQPRWQPHGDGQDAEPREQRRAAKQQRRAERHCDANRRGGSSRDHPADKRAEKHRRDDEQYHGRADWSGSDEVAPKDSSLSSSSSGPSIVPGGAGEPVPQQVVGKYKGHHGLQHRHSAGREAGVVPPFYPKRPRLPGAIDHLLLDAD